MDKSTVCPSTREWVTCGTLHFMAVRKQRKRETWELLGQDTAGQKTTPVTHFLSAQRHQLGTEHSACEPVGLFCIQTMAQVSGFVLLNHLAFESKRKQKSLMSQFGFGGKQVTTSKPKESNRDNNRIIVDD